MDMHWLQKALLGGQPLGKNGKDAGKHSLDVRTHHKYVVADASTTVFLCTLVTLMS